MTQDLWERVQARQTDITTGSVILRGALKAAGRMPRHVLSGLLVCEQCGSALSLVNGREYGCNSYRGGGLAACSNTLRLPIAVAEQKLLGAVVGELLSPEGVALLERKVREHSRAMAVAPAPAAKPQAALIAKKTAEMDQLRAMMKSGALSQVVAQAALATVEQELKALDSVEPAKVERDAGRIIRMLPRAADLLRQRVGAGNLGLRDPRSIVPARNALFAMFGGKVPVRPGSAKPGERPFLVARLGLDREVLLQAAASAASCRQFGSGGPLC